MKRTALVSAFGLAIMLLLISLACSTKPGSEEESVLIESAKLRGEDPLDAIYRANMAAGKAGERVTARMSLELAKQLRENNEIMSEIRDELRQIRIALEENRLSTRRPVEEPES